MLCFSYGSNMSLARIRDRVPSARFFAVATLKAHRLQFHKISKDGSGKCDAKATENPEDKVVGIVYEFADNEKPCLDRKEGLGAGYDEKEVEVITPKGKVSALMYFATKVDSSLKPYCWYKKHVLVGARENRLPVKYIAQIEAVETIDDPDVSRCERELEIYR